MSTIRSPSTNSLKTSCSVTLTDPFSLLMLPKGKLTLFTTKRGTQQIGQITKLPLEKIYLSGKGRPQPYITKSSVAEPLVEITDLLVTTT